MLGGLAALAGADDEATDPSYARPENQTNACLRNESTQQTALQLRPISDTLNQSVTAMTSLPSRAAKKAPKKSGIRCKSWVPRRDCPEVGVCSDGSLWATALVEVSCDFGASVAATCGGPRWRQRPTLSHRTHDGRNKA